MGGHNSDRIMRLRSLRNAAPGWVWVACCSACGHMAGLPVRQLLDQFGELYPVDAAMMKLRCTACDQGGQVTARLGRLCNPGCRNWRGRPNIDAGGEVGGSLSSYLQGGKARAACFCDRCPGAPFRHPDQVDRDRSEDVLQVRFGETDVSAPAQAAAADGLCVRALDAGVGSVAIPERRGLLVLARTLQRLKAFAHLQPDDARLAFGAGAMGAQRAWRAVPPGEAQLERHVLVRAGSRQPETFSLPAGQVTTLRSRSTWKAALVSPPLTRACQLGSSATGPTTVTP